MYPWIWLWSPHLYFPWSGSVAQKIEPDTNWFFDSIDSTAGDGKIEQKAFEIASYGRQLGLITEVILGLANDKAALSGKARTSLKRLEDIQTRIEQVKDEAATTQLADLENALVHLRDRNPEAFESLKPRLLGLINDDHASGSSGRNRKSKDK